MISWNLIIQRFIKKIDQFFQLNLITFFEDNYKTILSILFLDQQKRSIFYPDNQLKIEYPQQAINFEQQYQRIIRKQLIVMNMGIFENGFLKNQGKLYFGELNFKGDIENDRVKDGVLIYEDGSEYKELFQIYICNQNNKPSVLERFDIFEISKRKLFIGREF